MDKLLELFKCSGNCKDNIMEQSNQREDRLGRSDYKTKFLEYLTKGQSLLECPEEREFVPVLYKKDGDFYNLFEVPVSKVKNCSFVYSATCCCGQNFFGRGNGVSNQVQVLLSDFRSMSDFQSNLGCAILFEHFILLRHHVIPKSVKKVIYTEEGDEEELKNLLRYLYRDQAMLVRLIHPYAIVHERDIDRLVNALNAITGLKNPPRHLKSIVTYRDTSLPSPSIKLAQLKMDSFNNAVDQYNENNKTSPLPISFTYDVEKTAAYIINYPGRYAAHNRRPRKRDRSKMNQYNKTYKEKHPDRVIKTHEKYLETHPDERKETSKKYYENNKEEIAEKSKIRRNNKKLKITDDENENDENNN